MGQQDGEAPVDAQKRVDVACAGEVTCDFEEEFVG